MTFLRAAARATGTPGFDQLPMLGIPFAKVIGELLPSIILQHAVKLVEILDGKCQIHMHAKGGREVGCCVIAQHFGIKAM
nr:hypothetical protein [uncultured Cupriavidus sp.]